MEFGNRIHRAIKRGGKWHFHFLAGDESAVCVPNPSCGWYRIYPFTIPDVPDEDYLITCLDDTQTICMVELCLERYPDRELDEAALDDIRRILQFFVSRTREIIVRPTYDLVGDAFRKEPQKADIICGHLRQLGGLFREFGNHIFIIQGLLLGNWGEMHGSRYLTRSNVEKLYAALRSAAGPDVWIAVRRPKYARWITLDPSGDAKLCLFNDAILSSETDMGTYSSTKWPGSGTWFDTWTREKEIDFQRSFCLHRPNGGEVAMAGMPFVAKDEQVPMILQTMQDMHIAYLNSQYDARVFEQWKNMTVPGKPDESCFDEIARRIGYRFVVKGVSVKGNARPEEIFISMENNGFSNFLSEGELWMEWECGTTISRVVDTDVREWYAGKTVVIHGEVPQELTPGTWKIRLLLKRKSDGRVIRFANQGSLSDGSLVIGELNLPERN